MDIINLFQVESDLWYGTQITRKNQQTIPSVVQDEMHIPIKGEPLQEGWEGKMFFAVE